MKEADTIRKKIIDSKSQYNDTIISPDKQKEKEFADKWNGILVKHRETQKIKSIVVVPVGITMSEMIKAEQYNPNINITYGTYELLKHMYEIVPETEQ